MSFIDSLFWGELKKKHNWFRNTEVGIYTRKKESKIERKHAFDQESYQEKRKKTITVKKKRKKRHSRQRKKEERKQELDQKKERKEELTKKKRK